MDTAPEDWKYVAEGGANLVVAYVASIPAFQDQVLRIRKRAHAGPVPDAATLAEEDASVAFTYNVVIPLLPPYATPQLGSLPASPAWLQALSDHIEPSRPPARRRVDKIDTERAYVVLAQNLVGTSNDEYEQVSIEIKPKWGFLPQQPRYLSDASREIKMHHCRFCLHRLYRSETGGGAGHGHASQYCPLDLYSQDETRVQKAVMSLVQGWATSGGKGNNFKLFVEGQMVSPDRIPPNDLIGNNVQDLENKVTQILTPFLTKSPVLHQLQYLQSHLDSLDIEGLGRILYQREGVDLLSLSEADITKLGGEISLLEYTSFVERYTTPGTGDTSSLINIAEIANTRDLVMAYLLSATFKDCSMFIRIRTPKDTAITSRVPLEMQAYLVDCDVKSISRLGKYAKLDRDLVECCRSYIESGGQMNRCVASST